jgi:hypothetical protein
MRNAIVATVVLAALVAGVLHADAATLPTVSSGARPGPDVLYAPAPAAPQLENRDARFDAAPLLVSGEEAYVAGEYLYQDFLYDDFGSNTDGAGALPLSPRAGDITYPTNTARYGNNAADLVEFRIAVSPTEVAYRITLNTLLEADSTIVAIAFDTDHNAVTGTATLSRDPGAPFPGTDEAIFIWGTGAEHVRYALTPVTTTIPITTDLEANQLTVVVPRSVSNPTTAWRTTIATGLYDPMTGGWLRPGISATATAPGGANELDPVPCGIFNLGLRFNEPILGQDTPPDSSQSSAIQTKTPTTFAHDIDFAALTAGTNSTTVPASGTQLRIFPSRLTLGEGREEVSANPEDPGPFPQYRGQLQPYSLYVPTTYVPGTPAGLTLNLHSLSEHYWQYHGATMVQQIGESRGNFVATSMSRGPDGWYQHEAEYDVFEMWADVAAHFTLDPDRVASSGYSMGGYATYRLPTLYPDLFGKAFTQVGPPADGIWVPPGDPTGGIETLTNLWLENARNTPYLNVAASSDELVPIVGPRAQNLGAPEHGIRGFDQLGYRFRFLVVSPADHFAMAATGYDFPFAAPFLGDGFVDRNPPHVTFAYVPAADDAALGLVHDHGYWVSGVRLADETPGATPAKGVVDARSRGFGVGDPTSTAGTDAGTFATFSYVETNRTWGAAPATPVENRLDVTLTNVSAARVDLARAALDPGTALVVATSADAPAALALDGGPFPACSIVLQDAAILGVLPGPTGVTLPVAAGDHTYTVTCAGTFTLRRLVLTRVGGGLDRLLLRGRAATTLAAIGLPGSDLTLTLRDADGDAFTATVPAAQLHPNLAGNRLRFSDPSGTLAGGITRLRIGGRGRVDVAIRGRNLNLTAAGPGPVVALLQTATTTLAGPGQLRARGSRLVHP